MSKRENLAQSANFSRLEMRESKGCLSESRTKNPKDVYQEDTHVTRRSSIRLSLNENSKTKNIINNVFFLFF